MKKDVLGIKIDDVSIDEATAIVINWLKKTGKHYVVTPNPEIIVMAQSDEELKKILNKANLSIPDGAGLKLLTDIKSKTSGVDLMEELIKQSQDYGFTIGLLGGQKGVAEKSADCLRKKYPKSRIVYTDSGGMIDDNGEWVEGNRKAFSKTDLLFVAFGPPKQEKWIAKNLPLIPVKVAMVVGGSFDIISGIAPRAPLILRNLGLEWLFRLVLQPWRIIRQLRLIKFIFLLNKR